MSRLAGQRTRVEDRPQVLHAACLMNVELPNKNASVTRLSVAESTCQDSPDEFPTVASASGPSTESGLLVAEARQAAPFKTPLSLVMSM